MEKRIDPEGLDMLYMFAKKALEERNRGRSLVFVDDKLLGWVDEQVVSGKYRSRSHAIECALAEIKERKKIEGGSEVLGRDLPSHLSQTNNLPNWTDVDEADRRDAINILVDIDKIALDMALEKLFGDDLQGKIDYIKKGLKEKRLRSGCPLSATNTIVFKQVLASLNRENE